MSDMDVIVIGGGHNGLVAAAYLGRAGKKVLVLEQREILGGAAATEAIFTGFQFNTGSHDVGLLRSEIVRELGLENHGVEFLESPALLTSLLPDGNTLTLWRDQARTQAEIARLSPRDAERYPAFRRWVAEATSVLEGLLLLPPPDPAKPGAAGLGWNDALAWGRLGMRARSLGSRGAMELLRVLPMSVADLLDEWFESPALKGLLGTAGVAGAMEGPRGAGTAFLFLYHCLGGGGQPASRFLRGGTGQLASALAAVSRQHGVQIRTGSPVARIIVEDQAATGVVLADGSELRAGTIVSNADPRRALFELVGAPQLDPKVMRRVRNMRFLGSTGKVNLALADLPHFSGLDPGDVRLAGRLVVAPGLDYLEQAYDDAKYGLISQRPWLDLAIPTVLDPQLAPAGRHVMSIVVRYAPYRLRDGNWQEEHNATQMVARALDELSNFAPGLKDLVLFRQVLSPWDWEQQYGLSEGGIYHGQMALDQLLFMRPIAGYGQYRTPIANLYLCGAGTHPGGGVSGAPGFNAARQVLNDLKRSGSSGN